MTSDIEDQQTEILDLMNQLYGEYNSPVEVPSQFDKFNFMKVGTEDLLKVEDIISILDVYLWLNTYYPSSFYDTEKTLEVRDRCNSCFDLVLGGKK